MPKATPIPTKSRELVRARDLWRCVRCQVKPPRLEWHHRRSRSVRDEHTHCPCNGISLCSTCHAWVHAHPFEARASGLIVARHVMPYDQPLITVLGTVLLGHSGRTFPFDD